MLWSIFGILKNNHADTGYRLNIYTKWFWMTKHSSFYTLRSRHQANKNRLMWIEPGLCVHIENSLKHKNGILPTCLPLTCLTVISLVLRVFYLILLQTFFSCRVCQNSRSSHCTFFITGSHACTVYVFCACITIRREETAIFMIRPSKIINFNDKKFSMNLMKSMLLLNFRVKSWSVKVLNMTRKFWWLFSWIVHFNC